MVPVGSTLSWVAMRRHRNLGEPQATCEMCESQTIRYVHHMEHLSYDEVLSVGCICAGNMEGDVAAARTREAAMKSHASKRKRWLSRAWRLSAKGYPWLRADGYRVTVYPRGSGWATTVSSDDNSFVHHGRQTTQLKSKQSLQLLTTSRGWGHSISKNRSKPLKRASACRTSLTK